MTIKIGDVVALKSGGQTLTVASIDEDEALCLWIGEEGDFFRERVPLACLDKVEMEDEELDEEEEEEEDEEERV